MSGTQLHQTKRMINKLKAAGYQRSEFRVRTPCNHKGEYQSTRTQVNASIERQLELVDPVLAEGIDVSIRRYTSLEGRIGEIMYLSYKEAMTDMGTLWDNDIEMYKEADRVTAHSRRILKEAKNK